MSAQIKVFNNPHDWSGSYAEVLSFLNTYGKDYFSKIESSDHVASDTDDTVIGKQIDLYAKDSSGNDKLLAYVNVGAADTRQLIWGTRNTSTSVNADFVWSGGNGNVYRADSDNSNNMYYRYGAVADNAIVLFITNSDYIIATKSQADLTCLVGCMSTGGYAHFKYVNYSGLDSSERTSAQLNYFRSQEDYRDIGTYAYTSNLTCLNPIVVGNSYLPHVFDVRYTNISLPVGAPSIISIKGSEYIFTGAHAFN